MKAAGAIKIGEDRRSDKPREGARRHVSSIEDGHAGGDLLAVIEHGDHVKSTGVEGRLGDAEQEATGKHALESLGHKCQD